MFRKKVSFLILIFLLTNLSNLHAQRFKFTVDTAYLRELHQYLQKSNKKEQTEQAFTNFATQWNSGRFTTSQKEEIIRLSNNMLKKRSNPYPHFYNFIILYNSILNNNKQISNISKWTEALEFYSKQKNYNASKINRLINSVQLFIDSLSFYENRAVKWKYDAEN